MYILVTIRTYTYLVDHYFYLTPYLVFDLFCQLLLALGKTFSDLDYCIFLAYSPYEIPI